jgi:hypothetical protein
VTIKAKAQIGADGRITLDVSAPPGVTPGEHEVTVIIDDEPSVRRTSSLEFPVDDLGPWPEGLSLRREDLYDDDER